MLYRIVALKASEKDELWRARRVVLEAADPGSRREALRRLRGVQKRVAEAHGLDLFKVKFAYGTSHISVTYPLSPEEERNVRGQTDRGDLRPGQPGDPQMLSP